MQRANRQFGVGGVNQYADFDLRRRNREDIDPLIGQRLEHLGGDSSMGAHADADDGDLGGIGGTGQGEEGISGVQGQYL